jgi:Holliday junction DNA helicase RuvA
VISRIRGQLVHKEIERLEVSTAGGVTYELFIPASVFEDLPAVGHEVELHVVLVGREEGLELYGFRSELERQLFLRLRSASGVGPRLALALLGSMSARQLVEAIRNRDLGRLQMVSGVGKKKAERIALELGDKLDGLVVGTVDAEPESGPVESTVAALMALGYSRVEAEAAVRGALKDRDGSGHDVESLVRLALAEL